MIQVYDYKKEEKLKYIDLDSLCIDLGLNRKSVIKAISRESKISKRYLISYGNICNILIKDKKQKKYKIIDMNNNKELIFDSFTQLVYYANKELNASNPITHYHRNMARGYVSYGRFKIEQL